MFYSQYDPPFVYLLSAPASSVSVYCCLCHKIVPSKRTNFPIPNPEQEILKNGRVYNVLDSRPNPLLSSFHPARLHCPHWVHSHILHLLARHHQDPSSSRIDNRNLHCNIPLYHSTLQPYSTLQLTPCTGQHSIPRMLPNLRLHTVETYHQCQHKLSPSLKDHRTCYRLYGLWLLLLATRSVHSGMVRRR